MSIIPRDSRPVKSAAGNPRDAWPDWTDSDRWVPTVTDDEPRPTADNGYVPTVADEAEASELLHDDQAADAEWDQFPTEPEEAEFSDPFDLCSDHELMECRGHHPSTSHDR